MEVSLTQIVATRPGSAWCTWRLEQQDCSHHHGLGNEVHPPDVSRVSVRLVRKERYILEYISGILPGGWCTTVPVVHPRHSVMQSGQFSHSSHHAAHAQDPETVWFRQDNAGCYHSATTVMAYPAFKATGIKVERLYFSDPQGGKGAADRLAIMAKSHIHLHLHQWRERCDNSTRNDRRALVTRWSWTCLGNCSWIHRRIPPRCLPNLCILWGW